MRKKALKKHLILRHRSREENMRFLSDLYHSRALQGSERKFDKLVSTTREPDDEMTIEHFLNFPHFDFITLQINWHRPEISYCASCRIDQVERFVWIECPYSERNYAVVTRLFRKAFGETLRTYGET